MKSLKWFSIALAALLFAPLGWAQPGPDEEGGPPMQMERGDAMKGDMGKCMAKRLDLTADQEKRMDAIRTEQREAMKPLREKLAGQMKELKALVDKKAGDAELGKALDGIKDTRDNIQSTVVKFRERHDAVLTPTQKAKLALGMGKGMKERAARRAHDPAECPFKKGEKKAD